jgi:hypothetical protein
VNPSPQEPPRPPGTLPPLTSAATGVVGAATAGTLVLASNLAPSPPAVIEFANGGVGYVTQRITEHGLSSALPPSDEWVAGIAAVGAVLSFLVVRQVTKTKDR